MKRFLIVLTASAMLWGACKNTPASSKCGICPAIAVVAPTIGVRIVDKTSGADLFLSPGSPYKFEDLKVSSSVDGQNVYATVDSTDKANRFVRIIATSTQTFKLTLGSLATDSIHVTLKLDSPKCCSIPKIHEVVIDNTLICSACGYNPLVTIKK